VGGGKFLSMGSSTQKQQSPHATIQISGGGILDLAVSPDHTKLAAACKDGALRLVDLATGTVIGG
jgi:WD40 repeat protein